MQPKAILNRVPMAECPCSWLYQLKASRQRLGHLQNTRVDLGELRPAFHGFKLAFREPVVI